MLFDNSVTDTRAPTRAAAYDPILGYDFGRGRELAQDHYSRHLLLRRTGVVIRIDLEYVERFCDLA